MSSKKIISFVLFSLALCFFCACDATEPIENWNESNVVFIGIEGNTAGIWKLNNLLVSNDSLITEPGTPVSLVSSKDKSKIYSIWKVGQNSVLFQINSKDLEIEKSVQLQTNSRLCSMSSDFKFIITYGYTEKFEIYNSNDLKLYFLSEEVRTAFTLTSSLSQPFIYVAKRKDGFLGIDVFNITTKSIDKTIMLEDENLRDLEDVDMKVSQNDEFLFISAFKWIGGGGYNIFLVVDIATGSIRNQFSVGGFAQLIMDNSSNYVYISDPAGFLYQFPNRINKILRYDISNNRMETFIDIENLNDIKGSVITTTYMGISKDDNHLYVSVEGDLKTNNGNRINLLQINTYDQEIEKTFEFKLEDNRLTKRIRSLIVI